MVAAAASEVRTVDPITFEILSHRLHQITKEMGTTLERVGGTVNTTQMHDYMSALYRANGDVLSPGDSAAFHVACAGFAVKHILKRFSDDDGIDPGDVFLLNDPYVAAIHQSDVYVIAPIHDGDRLVAWSATFVHVMDIGAMSPGGNSPGATEICHEGVRIPGIKLLERGKLRRDVFDAITNMTRQPVMVGLDLKCEIAANNVARSRIQEMCAQYGADLVDDVSRDMIAYSERILRSRLREIPDGRWTVNGSIQTSETWNVHLTLTKDEDRLLFDFTGTDPQARVGINLPYHATFGNCFGALLSLLGWDIPRNHGAFAPIKVIAPPGSIVNPQCPAPVSLNTTSGGAVTRFLAEAALTQMVATSERWNSEVMGKSLGHRLNRHAGVNQYGRYYVSTLTGLDGSGATAHADGVDSGGRTHATSHNIEFIELNFPVLHLFNRHLADGVGAGRYRGGAGVEWALTLHDAPEGKIKSVALGVAGLRNSGQGIFGGYPAAPSLLELHTGTQVRDRLRGGQFPDQLDALGGETRLLPYCDFEIGPTDVLHMSAASGGGYGDPLERDPVAVLDDVLSGLISVRAAESVYGVCLAEGAVDEGATIAARSALAACRKQGNAHRTEVASTGPALYTHPLRENLEVAALSSGEWIRCVRCQQNLCRAEEDWTAAAATAHLDPLAAGPGMVPLREAYALQQRCCPSCGALFDTDIVEVSNA